MPALLALGLLLAAALAPEAPPARGAFPSEADRARIASEIDRLGAELARLSASERGLLGEINRLDALARLRSAERESLEGRAAGLTQRIEETERQVGVLESRSAGAEDALRRRLRALYRLGALREYRLLADASSVETLLAATRTASALAASDANVVARARQTRSDLVAGREALRRQQADLRAASEQALAAEQEINRTRLEKERLLSSIRQDRQVRTGAIEELRRAGSALDGLAGDVARRGMIPAMDFNRFQGLLPWPAAGRVRTPFGPTLHPRFQTVVPHDGIDLGAPYGADIRAVFDGTVAWASWLSGYGLTVLIDHGNGFASVYAHASALVVEPGDAVRQGQVVGQVGDTGSLEGALLYFEIRKNGRPVDPRLWLKAR